MKKMSTLCFGVLVSISLLVSIPAFGEDAVNVEHKCPVIIKVYGAPVGIFSIEKPYTREEECTIKFSIFATSSAVTNKGETLRIKVIGDKDIIVRCNGKNGITINRE